MKTILSSAFGRAIIAFSLVLLLGLIFNADSAFFELATHREALRQASMFGILACGLTAVILTGGIGSTVAGMLIIGYLEKILSINAVSEANRLMLTGLTIIAAGGEPLE